MADEVLKFNVTLKPQLLTGVPERSQDAVRKQLEQEGIDQTVQKHDNGDWVKYLSAEGDGLHASILVEDHINHLMVGKYERAIERGAGGAAKSWSIEAVSE